MSAFFANSRTAVVHADADTFKGTLPELEKIATRLYQYGNVANCSWSFENKLATIVFSLTEDALKFAEGLLLDRAKKEHEPSKEYLKYREQQKNKPHKDLTEEDLIDLYDADKKTPLRKEEQTQEQKHTKVTPEEEAALKKDLYDLNLQGKKYSPRKTEESSSGRAQGEEVENPEDIPEELETKHEPLAADIETEEFLGGVDEGDALPLATLPSKHPLSQEEYSADADLSTAGTPAITKADRLKKIKEIVERVKNIPEDKIPEDIKDAVQRLLLEEDFEGVRPQDAEDLIESWKKAPRRSEEEQKEEENFIEFKSQLDRALSKREQERGVALNDAQLKKVTDGYLKQKNIDAAKYYKWLNQQKEDEGDITSLTASTIDELLKYADADFLRNLSPNEDKDIVAPDGSKQTIKKQPDPQGGEPTLIVKDKNDKSVAYAADSPALKDLEKSSPIESGTIT